MKIIKPTLLKIFVIIVILFGSYFYSSNNDYIRYSCAPGQEDICSKNAREKTQKVILTMTLVRGLPVGIIAYLLIGLVSSRRRVNIKKTVVS